ncbi:MAG: DUF6249 domain-containing protein [Bacteroidota bacterium]
MTETIALFIPILGTIGTFSSLIIWIYMHYTARHKERMALIERDKDASIFKVPSRQRHGSLKVGIVAIMIGFGILLANMLEGSGMDGTVAYFSMILLFGGSGLILFYMFIYRKRAKAGGDLVD